jgi:hypothetical protein
MRDKPNATRHGENLGFHNLKNKKVCRPFLLTTESGRGQAQDLWPKFVAGRRQSRVAVGKRGLSFFRARKVPAPRWFFRAGRGSSSGKIGARLVLERIFVLGKAHVVAGFRDTKTLRQTAVE